MPTLPRTNARPCEAGFSLIEILVVLAIFAITTAVIMPSTSKMMDQATAHAVFFDFQKQISDFRREANRTGVAIHVSDPSAENSGGMPADVDSRLHQVKLRAPWTYTMAPRLDIEAGGICSPSSVNLIKGDNLVMSLRSDQGDCRFIRLQTEAPRRPSSSSR